MARNPAEIAWSARVEIATSSIAAHTTPVQDLPMASRRLSARVQAILTASPELATAIESHLNGLNTAEPTQLCTIWSHIERALSTYDGGGSLWPGHQ